MSERPNTKRQIAMNLSASRALDGASENTASIPAVDPAANRRSDIKGEVADPFPIAPPARTSRRGFLMNSIVSGVSLAIAVAVPSPALTAAEISGDSELRRLGSEFEVAWIELRKACDEYDALHEEVLIATEEACPSLPDQKYWTADDANRYWQALGQASNAAGEPYRNSDRAMNAAYGKCDQLSRTLATLTPTTMTGIVSRSVV